MGLYHRRPQNPLPGQSPVLWLRGSGHDRSDEIRRDKRRLSADGYGTCRGTRFSGILRAAGQDRPVCHPGSGGRRACLYGHCHSGKRQCQQGIYFLDL